MPLPPNRNRMKSLMRSLIHWPRRSSAEGGRWRASYRCIASTWSSLLLAAAGSPVRAGWSSAPSKATRRAAASLKAGGCRARSARISGWVVPVPACRTVLARWAASTSPGAAWLTMSYASDTAWRYGIGGASSASTVTWVEAQIAAVPASSSSSRRAAFTRAASSGRRRQRGDALGELEQIQALPPDAEVEVNQDDRDLEDRDGQAAHRDDARLVNRKAEEWRDEDRKQYLAKVEERPERERDDVVHHEDQKQDEEGAPPAPLHQLPAAAHRRNQAGVLDEHHGQHRDPSDQNPDPEREQAESDPHQEDEEQVGKNRGILPEAAAKDARERDRPPQRGLADGEADRAEEQGLDQEVDDDARDEGREGRGERAEVGGVARRGLVEQLAEQGGIAIAGECGQRDREGDRDAGEQEEVAAVQPESFVQHIADL